MTRDLKSLQYVGTSGLRVRWKLIVEKNIKGVENNY